MQSQYLIPKFVASIFLGLVLANISIEASAQINSLKKFAIEDFSDVGRVKQVIELDPKVIQTAENFRPEGFDLLPGKLLRVSLKKEFVHQGQMTHSTTETVESAKGALGYFVIKTKENLPKMENFWITNHVLTSLNFLQLAWRNHSDWKPSVGSDSITDRTGYVTELKLPLQFESALRPGANWGYEFIFEMESSSFQGVETRKSGTLKYIVEECRNEQETPASDLHNKLTGKMIVVQCQSKVAEIGNYAKFAYLKDYGFFMPMERRNGLDSSIPKTTIIYKISDIEFAPTMTKSN
ncbi:hypothetical protein H8K35_14870 [Undibacterium sp. LX40W]|uniref:Uncharacterized protein n=1 Tax=Undibacterium nitidum TaxID=2762298 RepID=A0A923HP82_9BURK|nr:MULTISPECIES: hypothetical protein [Undibacterium]MBC3882672.1 hypothetical protein [Undibacterium nitidum]MBC3892953.1 hypothetical protein [Undibacterium sp. LX40W]